MATTIPTKLKKAQVSSGGQQQQFDASGHTFKCLLVVAGSGAPSTINTGVQFVADVTAGNSEVTGATYARQTLTGVSVAFDGSVNTQVDWSFANITFAHDPSGFNNARYAIIYDSSIGSTDATFPVTAVCDLNSNQSNINGDLVLSSPSGGLIQWS